MAGREIVFRAGQGLDMASVTLSEDGTYRLTPPYNEPEGVRTFNTRDDALAVLAEYGEVHAFNMNIRQPIPMSSIDDTRSVEDILLDNIFRKSDDKSKGFARRGIQIRAMPPLHKARRQQTAVVKGERR